MAHKYRIHWSALEPFVWVGLGLCTSLTKVSLDALGVTSYTHEGRPIIGTYAENNIVVGRNALDTIKMDAFAASFQHRHIPFEYTYKKLAFELPSIGLLYLRNLAILNTIVHNPLKYIASYAQSFEIPISTVMIMAVIYPTHPIAIGPNTIISATITF